MNAEAYRDEEMYREVQPNVISIKRNPYLMDYEQQIRLQGRRGQRMSQGQGEQEQGTQRHLQRAQGTSQREQGIRQGREMGRAPQGASQSRQGQEMRRVSQRPSQLQQGQEMRRASQRASQSRQGQEMRRASQGVSQSRQGAGMRRAPQTISQGEYSSQMRLARRENTGLYQEDTLSQAQNRRALMEKKRAALRRRRIVRMQRMVLLAGIFCIVLLCGILCLKRMDVNADGLENKSVPEKITDDILPAVSLSGMVQGLPATEFAKHPEWEEKFLTPNEYSRPGGALEEVNSIFVHYTANPNTSAAQNRSYFEQLKDTHITSASAHFIIGYNGEIIQCIPLDEIAYAVQTRNYDSVSIECCYQSKDGSFTQETYDSLIKLLAWLTDVYDLTTDDILRHYDCGGKKCPIYYTEHEDAWTKLKSDVAEKL